MTIIVLHESFHNASCTMPACKGCCRFLRPRQRCQTLYSRNCCFCLALYMEKQLSLLLQTHGELFSKSGFLVLRKEAKPCLHSWQLYGQIQNKQEKSRTEPGPRFWLKRTGVFHALLSQVYHIIAAKTRHFATGCWPAQALRLRTATAPGS